MSTTANVTSRSRAQQAVEPWAGFTRVAYGTEEFVYCAGPSTFPDGASVLITAPGLYRALMANVETGGTITALDASNAVIATTQVSMLIPMVAGEHFLGTDPFSVEHCGPWVPRVATPVHS